MLTYKALTYGLCKKDKTENWEKKIMIKENALVMKKDRYYSN
jgi:hypothetical protein